MSGAWLARLPGITWVVALCITLITAAGTAIGVALYRRGVRHGEVKVHQTALRDSVKTAAAAVVTATAHSDSLVRTARKTKAVSDTTRESRVAARQAALAELCGDPALPKIRHLIALDDTIIRRDAATITAQQLAIDALLAERVPRAQLDTLRLHTIELEAPAPASHWKRNTVIVATAVVAVAAAPKIATELAKLIARIF